MPVGDWSIDGDMGNKWEINQFNDTGPYIALQR